MAGNAHAVYVANADSADISVLAFDAASGALAPLQRLDAGGTAMPLAVSPDRRFLYASIRSEPVSVLSLAIDPQSGRLTRLGKALLPASMCWISTDRSGRFLLSASYGGSVVAVSPIDADGAARAAHQVLATAPKAHSVRADPSNRFAFVACLGGGVVMQLCFDEASGHLGANDPPAMRPHDDASPRHFVFHPTAPFVYLLNELEAHIDVLSFDVERGVLGPGQSIDTLPPGFSGEPWAADIHVTPDGRFVYASERRSSTLAAFAVDASSGRLALIEHVPTEAQPRGFAIDPSGRWLLAVGQLSHRLSIYAIDAASGRLAKHGESAVGRNPNWVEIVALD